MDTNIVTKPCVKCGSTDRNAGGKCRECNRRACKLAYLKNKEKYIKNAKDWAADNRERSREIKKKWRDENQEKQLLAIKRWQENNPERVLETRREWRLNNSDLIRTYCINRRRKLSEGQLSKDIVEKLMILQDGKCACCGIPLGDDYHIDHIMPIKLGGKNVDSNVQLLLSRCNLKKNAKHPDRWKKEVGLV